MKEYAVETHFMIEISTMKGFLNLWHLQYLWTVMDIERQYVSAVLTYTPLVATQLCSIENPQI